MLKRKRIGRDIYYRGMKGGIKSINTLFMMFSLYELLKTYATINMQKSFQKINIPKLPVLTTEQGIKLILDNISSLDEWNEITNLIPKITKK